MDNEIKRLIELSNEQLRTKGKLLQEIVELKKQIVQQDKNVQLIGQLQKQVEQLNREIVDHVLQESVLSAQIDELKQTLSLTELQKENAFVEIERLKKMKWYKRIIFLFASRAISGKTMH